ncbi:MAG TPA: ATP-binding protein [Gemmatimonadaceae bacterium]|jgi:signal transduction histidine kinase/CheY-like chemotaxis protein/HPt (histidine-containing phosphotransfer) domain-containing protein
MFDFRSISRRDVATTLIGGIIAALLNVAPVVPYYGVSLHLGSIVAMAVAITLGAPLGTVAAVISLIPIAVRGGEAVAMLFAVASVAVVGIYARRRVAPIVSTLVFVGIAGPLAFVLLKFLRDQPAFSTRAVITGLVIDAVVGAMWADLLRSLRPIRALMTADGGASKRAPLRVHLFRAFAMVSALPLLISGVVAGRAYARRLEADAERRLNDEAASLSAAIDDYVVMHRETLGRLATTIERERRMMPSASPAEPLAEYHAAHGDFITLFVTDHNGRIVAAHHRINGIVADAVGGSVADRPYFQNVIQLDAPYISRVFRARELGNDPVVAISTPIHDRAGHVTGIVEGSLDASHFARLEPIVSRIPSSTLYVLDDSARVVYSLNAHTRPLAPLDTANMSDQLVGSATSRSGWHVVLTQPLSVVRLDAEAFFDTLMLATIAVIALSFVFASMLARRVTTPIEQLASEARRFGERGEPIEEVSVSANGPREVATLVEDVRTLTVDVVVALAKQDRANRDLSELLTHLDELVQDRTQELQRATMQAQDASEAKSLFLATMSHELRTPLHGVIGMLRLLGGDNLTEEQHGHLDVVRQSADALLQLLNDLLDYSKIEAGKLTLESTDFEPVALARDVVSLMSAKAAQRGIALNISTGAALPGRVGGDAARIRQVLLNLVDNAVKFTERGSVELRLECSYDGENGNSIRFSVADTGIGMSTDQARRIFQPFTQADESTTRRFGGTGLGLAICRDLVAMMGGDLAVDTAPGRGSKFQFTLPFAAAAGQPAVAVEKPLTKKVATGRVLVVDDHVINRLVAEATLTNYGCTVRTAMGGAEALEILASEQIDLVFMDCRMPEMDGFEATRRLRLREQNSRHRTPVVALTAGASVAERERCKAADMDDFLAKPLAEDELLRVLNHWLGKSFGKSATGVDSVADTAPPDAINYEMLDSLQDIFASDTAGFDSFISMFRAAVEESVPELAQLVRAGDLVNAAQTAHRLAGIALQGGADRLGKLLLSIEHAARDEDRAKVDERTATAESEAQRVLEALSAYEAVPA